jgi:hypothetical protein
MGRARLTITDVVYLLMALAALAALYPVFDALLAANVAGLSDGEELIYSTVLPLAVMVLLSIIYLEARSGLR